jgi:hypothetical protein
MSSMNNKSYPDKMSNVPNENSKVSRQHKVVYCAKCNYSGGTNNMLRHFRNKHNNEPMRTRKQEEPAEDPNFDFMSHKFSSSNQPR